MALKHSRQRDAIYDFLKDRKDHPTADTIYQGVRKQYPTISLATVYRNLMVLKQDHRIRTVEVGDGVVHFDPDVSEHGHFVCRVCGEVEDIRVDGADEIRERASRIFPGKIEGGSAYFYGVCGNCLQKAERKDAAV